MGYTNEFDGEIAIVPAISDDHAEYINAFSSTRRMKRNAVKTAKMPDPIRKKVGLPIGIQGGYYVGGSEVHGQDDIVEYNDPPDGQPNLWCDWVVDAANSVLIWNGMEKFYDYIAWMRYLIEHFFKPWGYTLNGTISWQGEENGDMRKIVVKDNVVTTKRAKIVYEDSDD